MVGEIISEWWATSNRNGGRDHSGMVGDIERNQHMVDSSRTSRHVPLCHFIERDSIAGLKSLAASHMS
jgi:hypothetical protein